MNLTYNDFFELSKKFNLIPVYNEIIADFDTPVGAFLKVNKKPSFLLESVIGGEKWGRYSIIGFDPISTVKFHMGTITLKEGDSIKEFKVDNPILFLRDYMKKFNTYSDPSLPRFFGGMVGYISYDVVKLYEKVPDTKNEPSDIPDIYLIIPETLLIFDNLKQSIKILFNAYIKDDVKEAYRYAKEKIEKTINFLKLNEDKRFKSYLSVSEAKKTELQNFMSNFTKEEFLKAVERAKDYVLSGDVVQVVLSQRFERENESDPFDIYRALRIINPSPYMFYIDTEDLILIGSSPEILVRLEEGKITLRPIAGTRRRGKTEEEDRELERELLSDEKERAEHIMLVDLGRNDVGRVAEIGSVSVTELMTVERYSHVMHIVSNVEGILRQELDMFDLFMSCFPAGTVTGAPKVRAMQIIEEIEPTRRGPYAGAVGYFGFNKNMDMCIGIRMLSIRGNKVYVQAGAGIVADSIPENEYNETVNKAMAMLKAVNYLSSLR